MRPLPGTNRSIRIYGWSWPMLRERLLCRSYPLLSLIHIFPSSRASEVTCTECLLFSFFSIFSCLTSCKILPPPYFTYSIALGFLKSIIFFHFISLSFILFLFLSSQCNFGPLYSDVYNYTTCIYWCFNAKDNVIHVKTCTFWIFYDFVHVMVCYVFIDFLLRVY